MGKYEKDRVKNSREKVATSIFQTLMSRLLCGQGRIWPNFELIQALMYVIITCKYEKDPNRFFHYKSMGIFSDAKGQLTPQSVVETRQISNSSKLSCMSLLPAIMKRIGSKTADKKWQHRFPHYNPMGAICCHGNQSPDPIWSKTLCSISPAPMMLQIKFDCDRPAGLRDIHAWKFERTHGHQLDSHPINNKLTLCAFGSGELKTKQVGYFVNWHRMHLCVKNIHSFIFVLWRQRLDLVSSGMRFSMPLLCFL